MYVGQTTNPNKRFQQHKSLARLGKGYALHRAIRKYGFSNFYWCLLHENILSQEETDLLEKEEIQRINSQVPKGYNVAQGGARLAWVTEEMKQRRIETYKSYKITPEHLLHIQEAAKKRKGTPSSFKGKHHSLATRQLMSEKKKGWKPAPEQIEKVAKQNRGKPHSFNWNRNIGLANGKRILCIEETLEFSSSEDAKRWLRTQNKKGDPQAAASGRQKIAGGYHWRYL